jgi:PAS domain S-box-containing protein
MDAATIKVLLVEDSRMDSRLVCLYLAERAGGPHFAITPVATLREALALLPQQEFDVILSDLSLPDSHGLETFTRLHAQAPNVPILVLSGSDDEVRAVTAVREGAQDYLVKGRFDGYILGRAISYAIERQRAEERLAKSEAFYHSLVENLPQNIFRKDLNERFTFANQRFCQMLGRPLEQIIGRTDFDFYPPELAAKYQRDDREVIRSGKSLETIEENIAPTGEKIYVSVVKVPIYDPKGQILGTQCIFWDITERKRFEEQLQRANEELARSEAALRRSHEELKAAQLQLIQAEKMESIGTLAAGVAHEVKNPLAILQMGVNFLAKRLQQADENAVTVMKEMREAITRADSILRGLLDFSASRQLILRPEDLNALIEDTVRLVRHELSGKHIEVVQEWGPALPRVAVDRNKLQQVFVNIFLNAIQAMPDGGILRLRTFTTHLTETSFFEGSRRSAKLWIGEQAVVTQVDDSGRGIPQEHMTRIYDPFFTTKAVGEGTGLGLSVTRRIIELHGGVIEIKNRPEGGVRVTVLLKPHDAPPEQA